MKKYFVLALITFCINANAQITLEHVYDSAATTNWCPGAAYNTQLMLINFEVSGERYVKINGCNKIISIYDMNHSLQKTISLVNLPNPVGENTILYLSENLFNTDPLMEFMYFYQMIDTSGNHNYVTNIYNENGIQLFSDTSGPWVYATWGMQQWPIINSSQGTKMILSCRDGRAKVFSLPGTLSEGISEANNNLITMQMQSSVSNAYPNPNNGSTQIDYSLPIGINEGEIVFYDLQGMEVKRFKVDRTFNTLLVSTKELAAGTYYYQLQTSLQNSEGKKMIVIK